MFLFYLIVKNNIKLKILHKKNPSNFEGFFVGLQGLEP